MYEGCLSRSTHASGYDRSCAGIRGGDLDTIVPRLDQPTQACLRILSRRAGDIVSELNAAIRGCVEQINDRVTRHLGASRRALFEQVEPSALKSLPTTEYVLAYWKQCRAGIARAHDLTRAHALEPSALCRLDDRSHHAGGRRDRL
jgi:hypothetical protein